MQVECVHVNEAPVADPQARQIVEGGGIKHHISTAAFGSHRFLDRF